MKIKSIFFLCLMISAPLMAHEHDDEGEGEGEFDVESYQLTLQGTQAFGEACFIGVVDQGKDAAGAYFADVETSFNHEGVGPGRLHVTFDAARPGFLSATNETGAKISIKLSQNGLTLADALRYAVRWNHEDHQDSGLCEGLTVIHDAAKEAVL